MALGHGGGHGGFHLGMVVGNLIQVGLQVQGRMEGTSVSNTTLLCWLEERLYNPALGNSSAA